MNKLRAGNILIRISNIFYEVPDVFLFKSPKGDDCYLSLGSQPQLSQVRKEIFLNFK